MLRNAAYDVHLLGSTTPPVPVIAVGNLTAGGTGKTPLVGWITEYLLSHGAHPAVISRGYGRQSRGVHVVSDGRSVLLGADQGGDEPVQLARSLPGVPVIVGERRTKAAEIALASFHPDVLVLDDAFQHRAIGRHLNILVVDAGSDLTREPLLPAGLRREQLSGLKRASVLVFTHAQGTPGPVSWEQRLRRWFNGEILYGTRQISWLRSGGGERLELDAWRGRRCLLVSGIGKPAQFEKDVKGLGFTVAGHLRYRDHFRYSLHEVDAMLNEAKRSDVDVILTTEKDLARLSALPGALNSLDRTVRVVAAVLTVHPSPAGRLEAYLDACVGRAA